MSPAGKLTKRALVSDNAQTFDVLGWFTSTIVLLKILLQRVWELKVGWDDQAPNEIWEKWLSWRDQAGCLSEKHISRCYFPSGSSWSQAEFHGFSDVLEEDYGGVVNLLAQINGAFHVSIVMAKTKVAQLKQQTIPCLELYGAYILAHLLHHVRKVLGIPLNRVHVWCDSMIVLRWLNGNPRRFKPFVANRISSIIDFVPDSC